MDIIDNTKFSDSKENDDGLLCHIKASKEVIRRCSQLYESSKNDIELRKAKENKQLEEEIKKDEEKRKRNLIIQQQASNREKRAAIKIQRYYAFIELKKKVREMNAKKQSNKAVRCIIFFLLF